MKAVDPVCAPPYRSALPPRASQIGVIGQAIPSLRSVKVAFGEATAEAATEVCRQPFHYLRAIRRSFLAALVVLHNALPYQPIGRGQDGINRLRRATPAIVPDAGSGGSAV